MSMPQNSQNDFAEWLQSTKNIPEKEQIEKSTQEMIKEIEERCNILLHLDYDRRETKKRIKQNIRWEFELTGLPEFYNQIDKIADKIYDREKK